MDFDKLCMIFVSKEPFYGILLSSMERTPDSTLPTIGVCKSGNVFRLRYNPEFMESLSIDAAMQILKHETLHLAFNHFSLFDDMGRETEDDMRTKNIAADIEVNCYINLQLIQHLEPMTCTMFGFKPNLGTREYYKKLKEQQEQEDEGDSETSPQQQQNQQQGSQIPQSGKPSYRTVDDHSGWPRGCSSEMEDLQTQIDDLLVNAAESMPKGSTLTALPKALQVKIEAIQNRKKAKPVADWKRYFRRYLGNEYSELVRKSKKHPSKRFEDAPGNRHQRKSHILVAIDTSGSINMKDYLEFFKQIDTLKQSATFHVVECDTQINKEYDYTHTPMLVHGGGGTDFRPVIDRFLKDRRRYDALVYFTDGYSYIPENTPKETLWVISSDGDQEDRAKYLRNGASAVFIKHKQ